MFTLFAPSFEYCFAIMEHLPTAPRGFHWAVCSDPFIRNKFRIWCSENDPIGY